MSIDRKMYYCQDVSFPQLDLEIQCNPSQNLIKLFYGYQQTNPIVYLERHQTRKSQDDVEE